MKSKSILLALGAWLMINHGNASLAASEKVDVDASGKPLEAAELYQIYANKSWIWKQGAGYFSVPKRQFVAWSRENGSPSYGEGRWFIPEAGKVCFNAQWVGKGGGASSVTCFNHRKIGATIYQKREPSGEWYVFKHSATRYDDEFTKLRRGDYASVQQRQYKKNFATTSK